jgi:hypothetical protein
MSVEILHDLLRQFGAQIGLPDLAADEQGFCSLKIGDVVTLSIQYEPEGDDIAIFARLGVIQPEAREDACLLMLSANFMWVETRGATLSLELGESAAYLGVKEPAQALDAVRFARLVQDFVETAEQWTRRLVALNGGASEPTHDVSSQLMTAQLRV